MQPDPTPSPSVCCPDLPRAITSFGAAVIEDVVYVYGGHHGQAHHYYAEGQTGDLLRWDADRSSRWEVVSEGPRLQGLAMTSHRGKLYRLGGFEARNSVDEQQSLWSSDACCRYDPQAGCWEDLPAMPAARSSFDAAVLGDTLYVVGGWTLSGDRDAVWNATACCLDLTAETLRWRELPPPPFQRRALSVAALDGKIYVLGGMQADGAVSRATDVFDPQSGAWTTGPELPGEEMDAFGTACCTQDGRLYVSTSSGSLLRLSPQHDRWEVIGALRDGRFFHRMIPLSGGRLLVIGGASMQRGKYKSGEMVTPGG